MTGFKTRFARAAYRGELLVERLIVGEREDHPVIEPYLGYAVPDGIVARGRVLSPSEKSAPRNGQGTWANVKQMAALFLTDEVGGVTVRTADGTTAVSDDEGYVTFTLPRPEGGAGWIDVPVTTDAGAAASLPVLIPDSGAEFGVISDIDDTILETGAYSLARNLWTTFTGSALTRRVFPDAVALLTLLHAGRNPVFYVSSSPWNLHDFLEAVFARAGVVRGPKFLRDLGFGANKVGAASHGDHKGGAIDTILAANPDLTFVLMGDTGQHDAEVYHAAALRHPGRIRRVILRAPGPGADAHDKAFADKIRELGIDVAIGRDYREVIDALR